MGEFINTLERLIGLGFSPYLALIVAFLIVLALVIAALAALFWKALAKERKRQDDLLAEREADRANDRLEIEKRLTRTEEKLAASENRHDSCERDRNELRTELATVKERLARFSACPKLGCPMRLP